VEFKYDVIEDTCSTHEYKAHSNRPFKNRP